MLIGNKEFMTNIASKNMSVKLRTMQCVIKQRETDQCISHVLYGEQLCTHCFHCHSGVNIGN